MTAKPTRPGLLETQYRASRVTAGQLPVTGWQPVPRPGIGCEDSRRLSADQRAGLIADGSLLRGYDWPPIPATAALAFRRTGDRSAYEMPHFARRHALTRLALAIYAGAEGLTDDLVNGIWAICEESFWGVSAHVWLGRFPDSALPDTAEPYIDLFAAATAADLAWVDRLAGHVLVADLAIVRDRLRREVQRRVLRPYVERDDWWWLGLAPLRPDQVINNWNPWIHSNLLTATLLLEPDPLRREAVVLRAVQGLDRFLATYTEDGGCDEGISYWSHAGGSLFEALELLRSATAGQFDAFTLPLVQEIGRFTYRLQIAEGWYVNFADGSARPRLDGTLIAAYGHRTDDPALRHYGNWLVTRNEEINPADRLVESVGRRILELFPVGPPPSGDERPPLSRDIWLPGIEVLTCRAVAGRSEGLFLGAKGGTNNESHNHNDVGQFIVAVDGQPVIVDAGVGTYTRQTFSDERYAIWTMRSGYHNLPEIDGIEQAVGGEFRARDVTAEIEPERTSFALDLAPAYPPPAGIRTWRRSLLLNRQADRIELDERWELDHEPASIVLHLLVYGAITTGHGRLEIAASGAGRGLEVAFDPSRFDVTFETVPTDDDRLGPVWGASLTRVSLTARAPASEGSWRLVMTAGAKEPSV